MKVLKSRLLCFICLDYFLLNIFVEIQSLYIVPICVSFSLPNLTLLQQQKTENHLHRWEYGAKPDRRLLSFSKFTSCGKSDMAWKRSRWVIQDNFIPKYIPVYNKYLHLPLCYCNKFMVFRRFFFFFKCGMWFAGLLVKKNSQQDMAWTIRWWCFSVVNALYIIWSELLQMKYLLLSNEAAITPARFQ